MDGDYLFYSLSERRY